MKKYFLIFIILWLFTNCNPSKTGVYDSNKSSTLGRSYLELNSDSTFTYYLINDISGRHKINGKWKSERDTIYLKESQKKYDNNKVKVIESNEPFIEVKYDNQELPNSFQKFVLNDSIIVESDINGRLYYNNFIKEIKKIEIYEIDKLLEKYYVKEKNKSYIFVIDFNNIMRSFISDFPNKLVRKGRRIYPLDSNLINNKSFYIKSFRN